MFFYLSKIIWFFINPINLLLIGFLCGLMLWVLRRRKVGRFVMLASALAFMVLALTPVSLILLRPLEDRFPIPKVSSDITGIIVLGGGLNSGLTAARGPIALSQAGGRAIEAAILAHQHPTMKIIFSGGSAAIVANEIPEAETARKLFAGLGIAPNRVVFEGQSRSTSENALKTRELIAPGQKWLLITSAFHMPRAVGTFRAAGIDVVPYPVAYFTAGNSYDWVGYTFSPFAALDTLSIATKEWLGLIAYWATGRTHDLFPG